MPWIRKSKLQEMRDKYTEQCTRVDDLEYQTRQLQDEVATYDAVLKTIERENKKLLARTKDLHSRLQQLEAKDAALNSILQGR